ncbi:MAG: membrane dipeptidase [Calditrichaeota bacterium]|nr:membrane dipeptidase [Calditrichota bacterium]
MRVIVVGLSILVWVLGSVFAGDVPENVDPELWQKAMKLHREAIVIDTHCDVTMKLFHDNFDMGKRHDEGHFDLPRAFEGGLDAQFFSIYVPNRMDSLHPAKYALELIDAVYRAVEANPDKIAMAYSSEDILRLHREGKIAALMGMENGGPIEHSLALLRNFYRLGVRYITLTHSSANDISDSSTDEPRWNGLSDFGRQVVQEMNRLGMLIDISHLSDAAIAQVLELSRTPVIASHSSCRALCDVPRNLPDALIRKVKQNGGVIHINFYSGFLSQEYKEAYERVKKELEPQVKVLRQKYEGDRFGFWQAYGELFRQYDLPVPDASVIVDHIEHVVQFAGVDHVGLGSDFDGVSSLPIGMEDVSKLPYITYMLLKRGFSEEDVRKILGGNLLRVLKANEEYARSLR